MDYQEFRSEYEKQHPASVPQPEIFIGEYPKWVTPVVAAMFITAALFSGVHTIPIAYSAIDAKHVADWLRQVGGISAFVFLDAGVLLSAYLLVKRFNLFILLILLITISVAMGANLYSVSQAFSSESADDFTKIITILFGLVAPLMAALSGGIYVWLHQSERVADAKSKAKFRDEQMKWDKVIEREWKKQKKNGSSQKFMNQSREPSLVHEPYMNTPHEQIKRVNLKDIAKQVHDNGDQELTVDEMMQKYLISRGSTSKVRELLTKNGFGGHD